MHYSFGKAREAMRPSGSRNLLYAATFALPAVLLFSSVRTFREIDLQREVYLRERAATIAGRLETASPEGEPLEATIMSLAEGEPHLRGLKITSRAMGQGNPSLDAVWNGRELFHTQFVELGGTRVYRAYVPFHASGEMNVAQIDLDAAASDFLVVHARHNIVISLVGGIVLILISLYAIWAARRTATLERKQLELQHLARLGTMSAVLAHEIRNPLGTIKGFAQLGLERGSTDVQPLLAPILEQTKRLEALVGDLLVYGRPPSASVRAVRWPEIAEHIEAHGRRIAGARDVQLQVSKPEIEFATDPDLVEHILVNLVRNALDAVESVEDPRVSVTAALTDGNVELVVRDNGPGIPESERAKICEPFFTTKAFGTGLGLPISVRLTEALEGTFDIQPSGPIGTVATVRLPRRG